MNILQLREKRATRRKRLSGLLPGKLLRQASNVDLPCKLVDVTPHGLGVVSGAILEPGELLALKMKNSEVLLEVAWGRPDFGKNDLYRYGLKVLTENCDLEAIFTACGLLEV